MELKHSFTVPVSLDRAWDVLLDVERVATCMPGASLDSVDGDDITGKIKVKVGPITQVYAGQARFTERNREAHVVTLEASGKETRGSGTASATVRSELVPDGVQTQVTVLTNLNVTGKAAQFGRGVLSEVSGKLVGIFADNMAKMLAAEQAGGDDLADLACDDLAQPIEELSLPIRAHNSLRREGVHTVADLVARTPAQLLAIENIGPASVEDIRQRLADRGLSLAPATEAESAAGMAVAEAVAEAVASANGSGAPETAFPAHASPDGAPPAESASAPAGPATSGAGTAPLRPVPAPAPESWQPDNEAVDLLRVAGLPVLKRALPVAGGVVALVVLALGYRRLRHRRAR